MAAHCLRQKQVTTGRHHAWQGYQNIKIPFSLILFDCFATKTMLVRTSLLK